MRSILSKLRSLGVVTLNYEMILPFTSVATIVQGTPSKICSLTASLLQNTPTSFAMLGKDSDFGVILSRLPDDTVHDFVSTLPRLGLENDLIVRCMIPRGVRSYRHNLYQRLLKPDGTWDDDVGAFLSQARSKRRELSESNA
jgi:hypothetical protein